MSMRRRTELIFQVVREKRMAGLITVIARSASDEAIQPRQSSGWLRLHSQ
jgi:hypothetical protein